MPSAVFESAIPAIKRLQACALTARPPGSARSVRLLSLDFNLYTAAFRCADPSFEEEEEDEEEEKEEEEVEEKKKRRKKNKRKKKKKEEEEEKKKKTKKKKKRNGWQRKVPP